MTASNSVRNNDELHESLSRFATNAARIAVLESGGGITAEQAAQQIGELYFELSLTAARNAG